MIYKKSCNTLRTLNDGNYGIFLIMGNAGFVSSIVSPDFLRPLTGLGLRALGVSGAWSFGFKADRVWGFGFGAQGLRV